MSRHPLDSRTDNGANSTSAVARWLARNGLFVFPTRPGSKRPWGNCPDCKTGQCLPACACLANNRPCHGLLAATSDGAQIDRWWRHAAAANVGVNADRSRLVVLDLDCKDQPPAPAAADVPDQVGTGLEALAAILTAEGACWPETLTVATPSGGRHLYFSRPDGLAVTSDATGRVGHQVDIRAEGGYVLAPGCVLSRPPESTAGVYRRVSDTTDIAPLPGWLRRRVAPSAPATPAPAPNFGSVRLGEHAPGYWRRIWHDELGKVETRDGERWRLVYAAARRFANLATHDVAPWSEHDVLDALEAAAIRRRQRTSKATDATAARRNAARGWDRGIRDGPDSLLGWNSAA